MRVRTCIEFDHRILTIVVRQSGGCAPTACERRSEPLLVGVPRGLGAVGLVVDVVREHSLGPVSRVPYSSSSRSSEEGQTTGTTRQGSSRGGQPAGSE